MQTQPLLICLAKALRTFGFGMVSVMLGVFLKERGFSLAEIGLLISATLVEDAVLSTLISYYANKLGYKNILLASSLIVVVSGVVLGVAADRLTLVLAIVLGIISPAGFEGGPFASIEHSLITQAVNRNVKTANQIQTQSHLTSHFSFYNLAGFGGAALGSLLCGLLMALFPGNVKHAFSVIFFCYAACGVVMAAIYSFVKVPASLTAATTASAAAPKVSSAGSISSAKRKKRIWRFAGLQSLDAFGGGFVVQTLIALWFFQRYQAGPEFTGPIFFWCNILAAISFFLAPSVAKRFGLLPTMVFTHLPCSIALCALPLCPTASIAGVLLLLRSLFSSIDIPVRQAYMMMIVSEDERVFASATVNAVRAGGQALSPMLAGLLGLNLIAGLPFILAGLCKSVYDVSLFQVFKNESIIESESLRVDQDADADHRLQLELDQEISAIALDEDVLNETALKQEVSVALCK